MQFVKFFNMKYGMGTVAIDDQINMFLREHPRYKIVSTSLVAYDICDNACFAATVVFETEE